MAVAYETATTAQVRAVASTGVTVNKPTGVATGDVLYAFISRSLYSTTTAFTSSGWTSVGESGSTIGNDIQTTVLRKVITDGAGEPTSYTFAVSGFASTVSMTGIIVRVSGADTTTPEDVTVDIGRGTNDATPSGRSATSATDDALAIQFCCLSLATTATKTWGVPSGWTDPSVSVAETSSTTDIQSGIAYKTLGTAGSASGTDAWTHTADDSSSEWLTAIVLVRAGVLITELSNDAEGGSNGTSTTQGSGGNTGGTSGDFFDTITRTGAGVVEFDSDSPAPLVGSMSYRHAAASGEVAYVSWSTSWQSKTEVWTRLYLHKTGNPTSNTIILQLAAAGVSGVDVRLNTDGTVTLRDAGPVARYTSTALANGTHRIEWHVAHDDTTGHIEARIFSGTNAHGATADQTIGSPTANWGTNASSDQLRAGIITNPGGSFALWTDAIGISAITWIGSAEPGATYTETGLATTVAVTTTVTDVRQYADTAATAATVTTTVTDTQRYVDAATSTVAVTTAVADVAHRVDTAASTATVTTTATDTQRYADTAASTVTVTTTVTDARLVKETAAVTVTVTSTVVDVLHGDEQIATAAAVTTAVTDTQRYVDTAATTVAVTTTVADAQRYVDAAATAVTVTTAVTDTAVVTDTIITTVAVTSSVADVARYADTATTTVAVTTTVTDTVSGAEQAATVVTVTTTATDSQTYTAETAATTVTVTTGVSDAIQGTEVAETSIDVSTALTETYQQADIIATAAAVTTTVTDTQRYVDDAATSVTVTTTVTDAAATGEQVATAITVTSSVTDSQTFVDPVSTVIAVTPAVADWARYVDAAASTVAVTTTVTDTEHGGDQVATTITSSTTAVDTQRYVDTAATTVTVTSTLDEIILTVPARTPTLATRSLSGPRATTTLDVGRSTARGDKPRVTIEV